MTDTPRLPPNVLVSLGTDGVVSLNKDFADALINIVAHNVYAAAGYADNRLVTGTLAALSGYHAGVSLSQRNAVEASLRLIDDNVQQFFGDGMDDNKALPKLNG